MNFARTEEQELLLESLREVVRRHGSEEYIRKCEEAGEPPWELIRALHETGFDMLGVPEEYGGSPCDNLTQVMYYEELCRTCSGGYGIHLSPFIVMDDMLGFGSEEQLADSIQAIKECRNAFCLGFSEAEAGSDSRAITTTYTRKDGKVYINGRKTFITRADQSKHMLCLAKNADETDPEKLFSTWWVPMNAPGLRWTPIPKMGWHMLKSCEVIMNNVALEEKDIVGIEGKGFVNTMKNFEIERLILCAKALGEATLAFEDAAVYANERRQFGKPIGSFQLIQEKLVTMYEKIENMRNLIYKAAWLKDQGEPVNTQSAVAKHYTAKASSEVIDDAIQIFGGLGYSSEMRLERVWRNNRIARIGGGTDEIMIHVAGRALLKQYKDYRAL